MVRGTVHPSVRTAVIVATYDQPRWLDLSLRAWDVLTGELLLTAAQSIFAVAILTNLSISVREAGGLLGLFVAQFVLGAVIPESAHGTELIIVAIMYLGLAAAILVRKRGDARTMLKDGFRTSYEELARSG